MDNIEELYRMYSRDLFSYLCSLTHNPAQAEDLLQETFLRALSSLNRFEGRSSVKTWLFGIARNLWRQSLSKTRRHSSLCEKLSLYIDSDTCLETAMITSHTVQRVQQLLAQKDEKVRRVVQMRLDGYSYFEISQELSICEGSARVADFRFRRWMREVLEGEGLL